MKKGETGGEGTVGEGEGEGTEMKLSLLLAFFGAYSKAHRVGVRVVGVEEAREGGEADAHPVAAHLFANGVHTL